MMEQTPLEMFREVFKSIKNHIESEKVLRIYNNLTIQFDVSDGTTFHALIKDGEVSLNEGGVPDSMTVVHWVAGSNTYRKLALGEISPVEGMWSGEIYCPDAYGMRQIWHWTMRLFRIAQESRLPRVFQTKGARMPPD
jgi:hypothetical protein